MTKTFLLIRKTAATGILPEHALRTMVRQGRLPHIKVGTKHLINYPLLLEWLDTESQKAIKAAECEG